MAVEWTTIGDCRLGLGDCREAMAEIAPVDLVLADPPYGMDLNTDYSGMTGWSGGGIDWPKIKGDAEPFDPTPWIGFKRVILWGANFFPSKLPDTGAWLVFNKRGDGKPSKICFGDCEIAWSNIPKQSVRMFSRMWYGVSRWSTEGVLHPSQKPVSLMQWCMEQAGSEPGDTICDPYMGSGTTGVACVQTGRKFIGCEIDQTHFATACRRIERAYRDAKCDLFKKTEPKPDKQHELFEVTSG